MPGTANCAMRPDKDCSSKKLLSMGNTKVHYVARSPGSLRRGSGYEQAKPKLRCIESDEVAVAFGPPA